MESYHGEDIYVWNPNPITDAHMKKVGTDYAICPVEEMPLPWTKAILQQEHPLLRQVQERMLTDWGDRYEACLLYTSCPEPITRSSPAARAARKLWIPTTRSTPIWLPWTL